MKRARHFEPGIWSFALVLATSLIAADPPRVYPIRREIPERGEVPAYLLVMASNTFSFIPPAGWTPQGKLDKKQVLFLSPEMDASLSFQIIPAELDTNGTVNPDFFPEQVIDRMPPGNVVGTFPCSVANHKGLGLDLEELAADKSKISIRAAWVPVPCGVAEFIFRAPQTRMNELRLVLGRFLASVSEEKYSPRK